MFLLVQDSIRPFDRVRARRPPALQGTMIASKLVVLLMMIAGPGSMRWFSFEFAHTASLSYASANSMTVRLCVPPLDRIFVLPDSGVSLRVACTDTNVGRHGEYEHASLRVS